jgi:hypothetical protein
MADLDCTHRSIRAGWQAFAKDYSSVFCLLGAAQFMCAFSQVTLTSRFSGGV